MTIDLLTPAEVAALHRVKVTTVRRWADAGKVEVVRTLGGHRRFPAAQFAELIQPWTETQP